MKSVSDSYNLDCSQPAVGLSVPATGKISSHKIQKEWHQSHFNGSWIIGPSFLHPYGAQGWVVGSATVSRSNLHLPLWPFHLPVGKLSMIATNHRVRACCVMLLTGLNFVKLVTNLNSCSLKVLKVTLGALRDRFFPLQVDRQKQMHSPLSCW